MSQTTVAGHELDRAALPLLLTLGLGVFAGALDLGVLSPALPAMAHTFAVAPANLSWIFTIYLLGNVLSISVAAALADRYGRRPIYVGCVALFAIGSALAVAAPSYQIFLAARALQALGAGGIFPVATAAIADCIPSQRRGAALGLVAATWGLAAVMGPLLGGVLTHFFSWRWIFIGNFPLAAVVIALAIRTVPANAPRVRGPLDIGGLALLILGLWGVSAGLTTNVGGYAAAGILLLAALILWERRRPFPLLAPQLFANRNLRITYALEVLIGILEGSLFFIPSVLVIEQHMSAAGAGGIAAVGAIVFVAVIPVSGRAIDRLGPRPVLLAGAIAATTGLLIFTLGFDSLALTLLAMVIAGVGFGSLLGAPTRYIVTREAPAANRATAIGLLSQFLIFGQIAGTSLAGGMMHVAKSVHRGFFLEYAAFTVTGAVAALAILTLRAAANSKSDSVEPPTERA
ncbi:MAG: hypothetical protein DLM50_04270 [Candidatus Meridianibacter frigidus]|nr:MAG: hypothetical protein DLM50_04270 [Candidatus Eremiobacteraeota bacterium]